MTPAQVARAAMRLADCLYVIAEEMRCSDLHGCIVDAARKGADTLWASLVRERARYDFPVWTMHGPADVIEQRADAWRSFGERLRAECERVAYNALVLANSAGADVAADITGETCGSYYCAQGGAGMTTITNVCRLPMGHAGLHGQPREVKRGA